MNTKWLAAALCAGFGFAVNPLSEAIAQEVAAAQDSAAQQQDGSDETGAMRELDTIVVTARRREETLQQVPVAVSALDWERLERTGAQDITALQAQTPNATVQVARGSNSTLVSFIRGVGQQDPVWGFEQGVGLYVDDVYIARPQGAVLDVYDIDRIEVLRGPQGTLYGRNTIGGAIKYVTRRLGSTPRFEGKVSAGSYNQLDALGNFAAPLSDNFSIGGAVARFTRDGYGTNLSTGAEHYDRDSTAYRFSAEFTPGDSLFFRLAYDKLNDKSNARHGHRELAGAFPGTDVLPGRYDTRATLGDDNSVETEGVSLSGDWYINDILTFRSITAKREGHTDTVIDFDGSPSVVVQSPAYYADEQFSQELQLGFEGDRVQGVVGAYYFDATAEGAFDSVFGLLGANVARGGYVKTESWSVFSDVSIDFTDRTRLSLGGRYTHDERTGHTISAQYCLAGGPLEATCNLLGMTVLGPTERSPILVDGVIGGLPLSIRTDYTNSRDFKKFTPRVSLSHDFSDTLTGYASYSQGFKSGGFDMRGDAVVTPSTVNGYNPESVNTYEFGLKGSGLDGRLNFSSAVFYSDYKDQQVTIQYLDPVSNVVGSVVENAGASTIYGAEFELSFRASDSFRTFLAAGYIHAAFDEFLTRDNDPASPTYGQIIDNAHIMVFQNTPRWTGSLGATWNVPLFGGSLAITPTASFRSSYHQYELQNPILDEDGYALVDLNAVWTAASGKWSIGLAGRNLTDEVYKIGGYPFYLGAPGGGAVNAAFDNSAIAYYGPPRTYTATFTYRY